MLEFESKSSGWCVNESKLFFPILATITVGFDAALFYETENSTKLETEKNTNEKERTNFYES